MALNGVSIVEVGFFSGNHFPFLLEKLMLALPTGAFGSLYHRELYQYWLYHFPFLLDKMGYFLFSPFQKHFLSP